MKSRVFLSSLFILSLIGTSNAEYIIKINVADSLSKIVSNERWVDTYVESTDWVDQGGLYDCGPFEISASTIPIGILFDNKRECYQKQERTVTTYEKSNKDNIRIVGEPVKELNSITLDEIIEDTGLRFNNTLTIGNYYVWGVNYYGYFSNSYISNYGVKTNVYGDLSIKNYKGYVIDHLVYIDNGVLSFRLLPAHGNIGMEPKLTVNGIKCSLFGPSEASSYDGLCNFNLNQHVGSVLNIDIE